MPAPQEKPAHAVPAALPPGRPASTQGNAAPSRPPFFPSHGFPARERRAFTTVPGLPFPAPPRFFARARRVFPWPPFLAPPDFLARKRWAFTTVPSSLRTASSQWNAAAARLSLCRAASSQGNAAASFPPSLRLASLARERCASPAFPWPPGPGATGPAALSRRGACCVCRLLGLYFRREPWP